jgi:hypothetical protein
MFFLLLPNLQKALSFRPPVLQLSILKKVFILLILPVKKKDKDERFPQEKNKFLERAIGYATRNCMTPSEFAFAQEK